MEVAWAMRCSTSPVILSTQSGETMASIEEDLKGALLCDGYIRKDDRDGDDGAGEVAGRSVSGLRREVYDIR